MKKVYRLFCALLIVTITSSFSVGYAQCNGNGTYVFGGQNGSCKSGIALAIGQHDTPTSALTLPHFKGGTKAMCRYINKTKVYPESLKSQKATGTTVVQAKVLADSTLADVEVVTSSGYPEFDAEALRVVNSFPKMCPATQSCTAQDFVIQIPVTFSPDDEAKKLEALKREESIKKMRQIGAITLYFENDRPDPGTKNDYTSTDYKTLFDNYMGQKETYISKCTKGLNARDAANNDVKAFFNETIANGYDRLVQFTNELIAALEEGFTVSFNISGFASPLSNSEYNQHLSARRIESVLNYMKQAQGGKLAPYINGSKPGLTIIKNPSGEVEHSEISNSSSVTVYGLQAAQDRRIEITNVNVR